MGNPQKDIFREGSRHHHLLEYDLKPGAAPDALAAAIKQARATAADSPCAMVVAFGPDGMKMLAPNDVPEGLRPFDPLNGPRHAAPATQRDVWFWIHGPERDDVFDLMRGVSLAMDSIADVSLDISGFMYHDARDITGFIDGSANPKTEELRLEAALVPSGQPGAGGAFVLGQKWVHDLESFNTLSVHDQEQVFGRTKPDSIELEGDAQPPWSHVSRTDLKIDGVAQKMYRRSVPYGIAGEHGLYFLGFTCDISRFDNTLRSMFGLTGDGEYDHLTDFSDAKTGSYFFAPTATVLDAL
jgi:putative iron-dependent peroxidase